MGRVFRARVVGSDLDHIFNEISGNNGVNVATAQLNLIERALERLGAFPNLGRERPDLRPGLRIWSMKPWQVLYRLEGEDVFVLRILDGRMDLSSMLGKKT